MGSATSLNLARSEKENPSLSQRESSLIARDREDSKTLVEAKSKEEDSSTKQGESRDVDEESKTLTQDSNETTEKEDEDNEECGFCTYIKGGECKESWIELEKCLAEAKNNDGESNVTKCKEARKMFKTCMYDNPVYYEPAIAAETYMVAKMLSDRQAKNEAFLVDKAQVVAKMLSELRAEKEAILSGDSASIVNALNKSQKEEERIDILPAEAEAIAKMFSEMEAKKKKDKEDKEAKGSEEN
ncbi:uncharacterized protein LOC108827526 [Raphanus sativus]|uniref:Uncharacterized protein LOC108827526 n=1 Tax=Raphanus sativus TaxID=3726 RepID=A0A6J0L9Z4_RAPSA|nr:uncharacterized protein LOC108827526 [Raphanus sativus]